MVRGWAAPGSELRFECDDGKIHRARVPSLGEPSRFSLSLPHGAICRLALRRNGHSWQSVLFLEGRNHSPLIYLRSTRIDLGNIEIRREGPLLLLGDDDAKLVAAPADSSTPGFSLALLSLKDG